MARLPVTHFSAPLQQKRRSTILPQSLRLLRPLCQRAATPHRALRAPKTAHALLLDRLRLKAEEKGCVLDGVSMAADPTAVITQVPAPAQSAGTAPSTSPQGAAPTNAAQDANMGGGGGGNGVQQKKKGV